MGYIIVTRNPTSDRLIALVQSDEEDIAEFPSADAAHEAAKDSSICQAWDYQVIEIQLKA